MKKTFRIEVDCANCAAKMEQAVQKLPGVEIATVSFMTQKMVVEGPDEGFDALMQQVVRACRKIEPDCEIYL